MRRSQRTSQHGTQNVEAHTRTTQKTKHEKHGPHQNPEGKQFLVLIDRTPAVLLIYNMKSGKSLGSDRGKKTADISIVSDVGSSTYQGSIN